MSRTRVSSTLSAQEGQIVCNQCGHALAPEGRPWKVGASVSQVPVKTLPGTGSGVQQQVLLRRFCCPGCGALLDTETAMPEDPFLDDVVHVPAGKA